MKKQFILLIILISFLSCKKISDSSSLESHNKPSHVNIEEISSNKTVKPVSHNKETLAKRYTNVELRGDEPLKRLDSNNQLKSECNCFKGIGSSEDDKPIIKSKFSNGTILTLCGYFDEEIQDEELTMSEFNIFNCETGKAIVEYGAMQTCYVEQKKDLIILKELKYLPIGENWDWQFIQIGRQEISLENGKIIVSNQIPELGEFRIDQTSQSKFLNSLEKGTGFGPEWESDLGRLEVLSLLGNADAWKILNNYEEFVGDKTDGALSEQWNDAVLTVEWIKKK